MQDALEAGLNANHRDAATPLSAPSSGRLQNDHRDGLSNATWMATTPQTVNEPAMLMPYSLVHNSICYTVLPLSPEPSPAHTALDPILPDASAFHDRHAVPPYTYPAITSATCSWMAILSRIWQPDVVWSCWKPATLGSYSSVAAIWEAWAEGERVAGISRKPPLRELEQLWGAQKNTTLRRG
ncbi:uncharacterized protein LAESUDRAFT_765106 [Laetiporus sulphureus 93-53]|uniref:Uncharacterized protein n=1 Tax=Laetiporus sulphureus 93-53 TaxID=1314785 RepID=A0A165AYE4_9APHY|nr:uncharacterized protein LAESUDRAFT_765106 [Laetiporus sulphureus 93-53]KZS99893.1 hypothetical protein LAESUDRAFT_765106 [Laetiporus sulphureus 93-53]